MQRPVQTIVLFDIETTGLLHLENYETRITELALVACERDHIMELEDGLPRVTYKLIMPVNPFMPINDAGITGLTNELLNDVQPFNRQLIQIINLFLERLPKKPVCLIAQNGDKFDFPILQQQLFECRGKLSDELVCLDSRKVFISILNEIGGLPVVYRMLHGGKKMENEHTAEGDCLGLLSCIIKLKDKFFNYLDQGEYVRLFSDVQPVKNQILKSPVANKNRGSWSGNKSPRY